MQNDYTLTAEQTEALAKIDAKAIEIREATGTNVVKGVRTFEEWAKTFPGNDKKDEPSANHAFRVLCLSALLSVPTERIAKGKATTVALGQACAAYMLSQPVDESVDVFAKEKEDGISESEQALSRWDAGAVQVSEQLKSLQGDDLNTVTSATHAAFHTALKGLSSKEHPFPQGAGDFVSYLLGASGGSTDWFPCSDKFITESKNVSPATIKRQRKALIEWQEATGKGVVDIKQESGAPTMYRVNLLGAVSAIVQNLISSENANPENLAVIAGLSGKLLTEGTEKLRQQVGEKAFGEAQALGNQIASAVDSLPAPTFEGSTSAEGRKREFTGSRFKELKKQVNNSKKLAETASLEKATATFGKMAEELEAMEKAFTDGGDAPDLDAFQARINHGISKIEEATKTQTDIVTERAEAERKATGETSTETAKALATVHASNITANEQAKAERKASFDAVKTKVYLLAELTRNDADASAKCYERLRTVLDEAFSQGSFAPAPTETPAPEATPESLDSTADEATATA